MPPAFLFIALSMSADPCGPLDLNAALALAANRSDEVAIKQADVATAQVDVALARALAIVPIGSVQLLVGPDPAAHGNIFTGAVLPVTVPGVPGTQNVIVQGNTENTNRSLNHLGVFERVDVTVAQPIWTWGQLEGARNAAHAGLRARELLVDDT